MKIDEDSPQVRIPPPVIALIFILTGYGLGRIYPLAYETLKVPGYGFIVTGLLIIAMSASLFRKSRTRLEPWKTTSAIVTTGVYAFSRNPIYLAFVIIATGISLVTGNMWILIMQLPFVLVMTFYVIRKEESYLTDKFGLTYTSYAERVRRWI